jgi:uncharacterized protein
MTSLATAALAGVLWLAVAPAREIPPASDRELADFRGKLGALASSYFDDDERRELYIADINNDGQQEYVLVARDGGTLHTDTLLACFVFRDGRPVPLQIENVMPDGAQMPLRFDTPFLVVEEGRTFMQFRFNTDQERWLWEGKSFALFALKTLGDDHWTRADAPSFDCRAATADEEKLICSDATLGRLDREMSRAFKKSRGPTRMADQRKWLRERGGGCARGSRDERVGCLKAAYESRIAALWAADEPEGRGERFGVAGFDDQAFEAFYVAFSKAVAAGDRRAASALIGYPVQINVDGGRAVGIPNAQALIARWDEAFGTRAPSPKGLEDPIVRDQGVGVDGGTFWFLPGDEGKPMIIINRP